MAVIRGSAACRARPTVFAVFSEISVADHLESAWAEAHPINSSTHLRIYSSTAARTTAFSLDWCGGVCKCNWRKELKIVLRGLCVSVVNNGFGGRAVGLLRVRGGLGLTGGGRCRSMSANAMGYVKGL